MKRNSAFVSSPASGTPSKRQEHSKSTSPSPVKSPDPSHLHILPSTVQMGKGSEAVNARLDKLILGLNDHNANLDRKLDKIVQKFDSFKKELREFKDMLLERDTKIAALEKKVAELEDVVTRYRYLEQDRNRYRVRILNFPNANGPYPNVRTEVYNFLESVNVVVANVADFQILPRKNGRQVLLTFTTTETANYLLLNGKRIFQQHKIRIVRDLTREQNMAMQQAIDAAKSGKENPRVNIDWIVPAAYVDGNRVWPIKSANRRQSASYATATKPKNPQPPAPEAPYSSIDPKSLSSLPQSTQVSDRIDAVSGHEFFGALVSWDGNTAAKNVVKSIMSDQAMPFQITDRDNVMYAGVAVQKGKIITSSDDGGEKGVGSNLLRLLEKKNLANAFLVLFRKFGQYQLGPDRYRLFDNLATKILNNMGDM